VTTRREVAQWLTASLAAAGLARARARDDAKEDAKADVVVVGAGAFGAWTAKALLDRGRRVVLIDAYGPGNSLSSSGDQSRISRSNYGANALYAEWAAKSREAWLALERRARTPVFVPSGVAAFDKAASREVAAALEVLRQLRIPIEQLSPGRAMQRFPQFHVEADETVLYEPHGGTLYARAALQALVADMRGPRFKYRLDAVRPPEVTQDLESIETASGARIAASEFVFACGPWLPKLFPQLLGRRIRSIRAEAYFLRIPPGSRLYEASAMPTWMDNCVPDAFGMPDLEARGCKVAVDVAEPPMDPDSGDRRPTAEFGDAVRAYVRRRIPGLADAPVAEARVCQYEMTPNEDYLLDRHPGALNVWIAGGGSGHGYKNGPMVGQYMAGLIERRVQPIAAFTFAAHPAE